jgi:resuscitation-promoting factor RpfB
MLGWFSSLSTLGKMGVASAATFATIGTVGTINQDKKPPAVTSPATAETQTLPDTVELKTEKETEVIKFKTIKQNTSSLAKGVNQTLTEGQNGSKVIFYEVTYTNNEETKRIIKSEKITEKAVNKVIVVGTYVSPPPPPPQQSSNCDPNYSPCIPNVSYDLDCPDIGMKVVVKGYDHHNLDADNDGYGCDSY